MLRKLLYAVVAILVVFQVTDFFAAPLTTAGLIKSRIGAALVENEVAQAFQDGGIKAAQDACANPILKMGFYYACFVNKSWINDGKTGTEAVNLRVGTYLTEADAEEMTRGRIFYDAKFSSNPDNTGTVIISYSKPVRLATTKLQTTTSLDSMK